MPDPTLIHVPPARLTKSPTNPRKHLGDLASLIESVTVHGVIEPILARKLDGQSGDDSLEIVAGERRWTAATQAGRETVPVLLRELSDDEALDLQLAENIERADLSPLEEAEAYALRVERGQTVQHIAERIGRPPAYVVQRLKLTSLAPKARERLAKGELTLGVALLLARIPERKLQLDALEEVTGGQYRKPLSAPQASKFIEERYMLRLAGAGFDRADANLVPGAGPCTTCPRRTGCQVDLFADVKSPDLCTDPKCFRSKLDAVWKLRQQDAKAAGQEVVGGKELEGASKYGQGKLVRLDVETYVGGKTKTVRAILGKACPEKPVLAQDPKSGMVVELVPRVLLEQAKKTRKPSDAEKDPRTGRSKADERKLKIRRLAIVRAAAMGVAALPKLKAEDVISLLVRRNADQADAEVQKAIVQRRQLEAQKTTDGAGVSKALREYSSKLSTSELLGLGLELVMRGAAPWHHHSYAGGTGRFWTEALELTKIDFAKLEKEVAAEMAAKKKPASKPKAKAAAPAPKAAKPSKPAAKKPAKPAKKKR